MSDTQSAPGGAPAKHQEMETEKAVKSVFSTVLDLPSSCVEFSSNYPDYLVVGTYSLEDDKALSAGANPADDLIKAPLKDDSDDGLIDLDDALVDETEIQTRRGSLLLYRVLDDKLELEHMVTSPAAILDLHFSPHARDKFIVALSTGVIGLYALQMEPRPGIVHLDSFQIADPSTLVLSAAWHRSFPGMVGATLSTGSVGLFQFNPAFTTITTLRVDLSNHNGDNAWTLAFSPTHNKRNANGYSIYSGGDDSRLRCVTFSNLSQFKAASALLSESSTGGLSGMGGHGAGVTAILPLPLDTDAGKDILITGSYDDFVRVYATYDYRPSSTSTRPKPLAELKIGGGVWRLKFLREYPTTSGGSSTVRFRVLASCMHAGARVLEVTGSRDGEWDIKVLSIFDEHKSMNYGSDARPSDTDESAIIVSSSFYDRLLCLWRFE